MNLTLAFGVGCWILDAGYWILDAGCWIFIFLKNQVVPEQKPMQKSKSPATIFIAAGLFIMATPRGFESLGGMADCPLNTDV